MEIAPKITKIIIFFAWISVGCNQIQGKFLKKSDKGSEEQEGEIDEPNSDRKVRYTDIVDELKSTFEPQEVRSLSSIAGLSEQKTTIIPKLMEQFCAHVYKLSFRADFKTELDYFCDENSMPKPLFSDLDRYAKVAKDNPSSVEISHKIDGEYSSSIVAVAYEIPIPPKFIKEAGIPFYMVSPAKFPYFEQSGKVVKIYGREIGSDLQFSRYDLQYETKNITNDGKNFTNQKTTEFNGYQVQGGNSDIGLGAEHLVGDNPDYKYFKTITITIGTESGGSIMINFANVTVKHNGYEQNARKSAFDIGTAQGNHVQKGVIKELPGRVLK